MPSQQEVRWSQLKVGVIVLVATFLLVILLFLITSSSGFSFFSHKMKATTYFENSAGLKEGAPVNLEGVTIGTVKTVTVVGDSARKRAPVKIVMEMDSKFSGQVKKDSKAALSTVGVLGDTVLDINSQYATGAPIQNGDELKTEETPDLQDVIKASQGTIESLNVILAKMNDIVDNIQSGKGSVGQLINSPDMYNKLNATTDELHKLAANLNGVINSDQNSVGKLLNDHAEMYNRLSDTLGKFDALTSDLQAGKGTAGKFLKDDSMYNNLNESLVHLKSIAAEADAGKGGLGLLLKDPAFAAKLNNALTQANDLLTKANSGTGTLGKIVNDETLYTNLNTLTTESTKLVTTIRQDPKKYLTIHMRIF